MTTSKRAIRQPRVKRKTVRGFTGFLFVLPCAIILAFMMVTPVVRTFLFSFSTVTLPYFDLEFAGFTNFINVAKTPDLQVVLKNTVVWTVGSVSLRLLMGLGAALVMNTKVKGINFFRVVALLPWTVPSIVSSNMWRWILQSDNGLLNGMLRTVGLDALAKTWLGSSSTALGSVMVAATWASYPFVMMMILSGMQGLSAELYESARIDGANGFRLFWHITLPGIKPVLVVVTALEVINSINAFDMLYTMTGGGPGNSSEILGLFVYRLSFSSRDYGAASAVSVALLVLLALCFIFYAPIQTKKKGG